MGTSVKTKPKKKGEPDGSMTLGGHLKELRNRVVVCAVVFFVVVAVALMYASDLIDLVTALGLECDPPYTFIAIAPSERLLQYFKIAIIAGAVVAVPLALYQAWAFAKPGLKKSESLFFGLTLIMGLGLFCLGVVFAYKISLPFMLNFLNSLEGTEYVVTSYTLAEYMNFVTLIFLIFGVVFEIPLVTVILSRLGIANPTIMRKGRGVAIVLIFVVAAIITPPDIFSQAMVAVPMILLYEISIVLSGIFYRKHQSAEEDEDDEDGADDSDDD